MSVVERPMVDCHDTFDRKAAEHNLKNMYTYLKQIRMSQHARDFWAMRAAKQEAQVQNNSLLHEHTAINQYLQWHDSKGVRLASFDRNTSKCLMMKFLSFQRSNMSH